MQVDPLQSITLAMRPIVQGMGISTCVLGWPDPKTFDVDGKLPILAIWPVHEKGGAVVSREQIHAVVNSADGLTATVYREQQRLSYTLQFSLFAKTEEDRSNIGWTFQQYFTTLKNIQVPIGSLGTDVDGNPVETALFKKWLGKRDDEGETGFFRRDMTFEVTARVLDEETAYTLKTLEIDSSASTDPLPATSTTTTSPATTTSGDQRIING